LGQIPLETQWIKGLLPVEHPGSGPAFKGSWTYERYFQSIQTALAGDGYGPLLKATERQLSVTLGISDLQDIRIYAEKHGNWYHPAKIEVITPKGRACFAMNVALNQRGREVMIREVGVLEGLAEKYSYPWVPKVFFYTASDPSCALEGQGDAADMFLADWFEGFFEFHPSIDPIDGKRKLILWDGSPRPHYLSARQTEQVYRQISRILTLYYDPRTYEQIFPWHHGAGDFVIRLVEEQVDVRLVTVRQYGPMADPAEMSPEEAMLFFFLNSSIRMRIDRLDGIEEMVWAEEACLDQTWAGFKEALEVKEKEGGLTSGFGDSFLKNLSLMAEGELIERFLALLESYDSRAPDLSVIKAGITLHITRVYKLITG
jgi:hypothetical protein